VLQTVILKSRLSDKHEASLKSRKQIAIRHGIISQNTLIFIHITLWINQNTHTLYTSPQVSWIPLNKIFAVEVWNYLPTLLYNTLMLVSALSSGSDIVLYLPPNFNTSQSAAAPGEYQHFFFHCSLNHSSSQ
jgi:hypothetical protein